MIERYRAANGIDDTERAWGTEPTNAHQGVAYEQAVNEVATSRTPPGQQGIEPSNEFTMDL